MIHVTYMCIICLYNTDIHITCVYHISTGSSRKSVKSKFVCTGINFHKKWILWGVLGSEITTNLSSTSTRSVFRFTGCIALWTARTTRWTRPGKRLSTIRVFQQSWKIPVLYMHPHVKLLRDNFTTNNALELLNICTIIYLNNMSVKSQENI